MLYVLLTAIMSNWITQSISLEKEKKRNIENTQNISFLLHSLAFSFYSIIWYNSLECVRSYNKLDSYSESDANAMKIKRTNEGKNEREEKTDFQKEINENNRKNKIKMNRTTWMTLVFALSIQHFLLFSY